MLSILRRNEVTGKAGVFYTTADYERDGSTQTAGPHLHFRFFTSNWVNIIDQARARRGNAETEEKCYRSHGASFKDSPTLCRLPANP